LSESLSRSILSKFPSKTHIAIITIVALLFARQLYLFSTLPELDIFYTPAHDLAIASAIAKTGSIDASTRMVVRESIYATYPAVHILAAALASVTGLEVIALWRWLGLALESLLFVGVYLIAKRLSNSSIGGALALAFLMSSDRLLDNGIHLMRENLALTLGVLCLSGVLITIENPNWAKGLVVLVLSVALSFSHPLTGPFVAVAMLLVWPAARITHRSASYVPGVAAAVAVLSWYIYQAPNYLEVYGVLLNRSIAAFLARAYFEYITPPIPTTSSIDQIVFYSLKWAALILGLSSLAFSFLKARASRQRSDLEIVWYGLIGIVAFITYGAIRAVGWRSPGLLFVADLVNRAESYAYLGLAPLVAFTFTKKKTKLKGTVFVFLLFSGITIAFTSPGVSIGIDLGLSASKTFPELTAMYSLYGSRFNGAIVTPDRTLPSSTYINDVPLRSTIDLSDYNGSMPSLSGPLIVIYTPWEWKTASPPPHVTLTGPDWSRVFSTGSVVVYSRTLGNYSVTS
jgi:hypothetical protein